MSLNVWSLWLVIGLFTLRALAACSSYGVDYVNGGSYDIDASSSDNFTFTTIFQGTAMTLCVGHDTIVLTMARMRPRDCEADSSRP